MLLPWGNSAAFTWAAGQNYRPYARFRHSSQLAKTIHNPFCSMFARLSRYHRQTVCGTRFRQLADSSSGSWATLRTGFGFRIPGGWLRSLVDKVEARIAGARREHLERGRPGSAGSGSGRGDAAAGPCSAVYRALTRHGLVGPGRRKRGGRTADARNGAERCGCGRWT